MSDDEITDGQDEEEEGEEEVSASPVEFGLGSNGSYMCSLTVHGLDVFETQFPHYLCLLLFHLTRFGVITKEERERDWEMAKANKRFMSLARHDVSPKENEVARMEVIQAIETAMEDLVRAKVVRPIPITAFKDVDRPVIVWHCSTPEDKTNDYKRPEEVAEWLHEMVCRNWLEEEVAEQILDTVTALSDRYPVGQHPTLSGACFHFYREHGGGDKKLGEFVDAQGTSHFDISGPGLDEELYLAYLSRTRLLPETYNPLRTELEKAILEGKIPPLSPDREVGFDLPFGYRGSVLVEGINEERQEEPWLMPPEVIRATETASFPDGIETIPETPAEPLDEVLGDAEEEEEEDHEQWEQDQDKTVDIGIECGRAVERGQIWNPDSGIVQKVDDKTGRSRTSDIPEDAAADPAAGDEPETDPEPDPEE